MKQKFEVWLDKLKNVWEKREPLEAAKLCADNFLWFETPFDKPIKTKEALVKEWQSVLDQENIRVDCEVISYFDNLGLAHWKASFTRISSGEEVILDGVFKVKLNDQGECTEFHQWYNTK